MPTPSHHSIGDPIEEVIEYMRPYIAPIIVRINVDEFTTSEFIQALNMDPESSAVYEEAIERWHENNAEAAKLVIHGQVIPQLLRRSGMVEWSGYAYGHEDPYGVPAWWKKNDTATGQSVD
ncbi:hypothetical protein BH24CHL1_BH24CHL1_19650 [soil metagenome]